MRTDYEWRKWHETEQTTAYREVFGMPCETRELAEAIGLPASYAGAAVLVERTFVPDVDGWSCRAVRIVAYRPPLRDVRGD